MNDLAEIACCPDCQGDSRLERTDAGYVCTVCRREFAIQDDIARLLPRESSPGAQGVISGIPLENPSEEALEARDLHILVIHGPNLNLLGMREPEVYGSATLDDINQLLESEAGRLGCSLKIVQSNHEGEIVSAIQSAMQGYQAIIINPAGYTHTSVAIRDALAAVNCFKIEVHLSNIHAREDFRKTSLTAAVANGIVAGFGPQSYLIALQAAVRVLGR